MREVVVDVKLEPISSLFKRLLMQPYVHVHIRTGIEYTYVHVCVCGYITSLTLVVILYVS